MNVVMHIYVCCMPLNFPDDRLKLGFLCISENLALDPTKNRPPSSQYLHADFRLILTHLLKATKTRKCRYIKRNEGDVKSCQRKSTNSGLSNPSVRMSIKTQPPNNKRLTCCQSFVLGLLVPKSTTYHLD